jgi:hypothetical protein
VHRLRGGGEGPSLSAAGLLTAAQRWGEVEVEVELEVELEVEVEVEGVEVGEIVTLQFMFLCPLFLIPILLSHIPIFPYPHIPIFPYPHIPIFPYSLPQLPLVSLLLSPPPPDTAALERMSRRQRGVWTRMRLRD